MRVVFDTNVIVSAFIARGASFEVFEHCLSSHHGYTSRHIRNEVQYVLSDKFSFPRERVEEVLDYLDNHLDAVEADAIDEPVYRDPSDDLVLDCALAARADCLITGDEDLLVLVEFKGIRILRPSDFWRFEKSRLKRQ